SPPLKDVDRVELATIRRDLSRAAGAPLIVTRHRDETVARFVARPDLASLADRGPLTPDHIIRPKRVPMVGLDIEAYVTGYRGYFERDRDRTRQTPAHRDDLTMLDPAPRVVLDPRLGMLTAGRSAGEADI